MIFCFDSSSHPTVFAFERGAGGAGTISRFLVQPTLTPKSWECHNSLVRVFLSNTTMVSSIVNFFLFNPPQEKRRYSFLNAVIRLKTARGNEIAATYIERKNANVTILFSHGNAEDLNTVYYFLRQLSILLDVNVIGYDYSGYGESTGKCTRFDYRLQVRGSSRQ